MLAGVVYIEVVFVLIKGQQHKKAVRTIDSSELSCVCVGNLNRASA